MNCRDCGLETSVPHRAWEECIRELRHALDETRRHLKYVSNIAMRLGPKAHNTHREEALALLDGTVRDAEAVYKKYDR